MIKLPHYFAQECYTVYKYIIFENISENKYMNICILDVYHAIKQKHQGFLIKESLRYVISND